jgi:hypothetical protein
VLGANLVERAGWVVEERKKLSKLALIAPLRGRRLLWHDQGTVSVRNVPECHDLGDHLLGVPILLVCGPLEDG